MPVALLNTQGWREIPTSMQTAPRALSEAPKKPTWVVWRHGSCVDSTALVRVPVAEAGFELGVRPRSSITVGRVGYMMPGVLFWHSKRHNLDDKKIRTENIFFHEENFIFKNRLNFFFEIF